MISWLWQELFHKPLYNSLVYLIDIIPGHEAGLAIIALTVLVRVLIFPLFQKSIRTQRKMRELEPELKRIREKIKDKQEQAKETMALYGRHQVNPFSGCLTILIQLPVFLALFFVFKDGMEEGRALLYSFVNYPDPINNFFLGVNLTARSYVLAAFVGISQYAYTALSMPKLSPKSDSPGNFQEEFARSMQFQMKYFFPILFVFISATTPSAVALYWLTSNIFSITQELLVRRGEKNGLLGKNNGFK